jgi:hypothetical protein
MMKGPVFWCTGVIAALLAGFIGGLLIGEQYFTQPDLFSVNSAKAERLRQERTVVSKDCRQAVPVNSPEIDGRCAVRLTNEDTDQTAMYEDTAERFSLEVPFSLSWGTDRYRLETVEKRDGVYYFGRPVDDECHWSREYYLEVTKASDPDKFMEEIRLSSDTLVSPEEVKIGGLKAYRLVVNGLCAHPQIIVFGARRAYRFGYASPCKQMIETEAAIARLGDLVVGLHLSP